MLLEVDRAVAPVRHHDVAALPGHLVVRVRALAGVDAPDPQALAGALAVLRGDPLAVSVMSSPFGITADSISSRFRPLFRMIVIAVPLSPPC